MITGSLRRRAVAAGALVLTGALALSACGDDNGSGGGAAAPTKSVGDIFSGITKDDALNAKLAADVKSAGKITVGTDPSYAPNEFYDTDNKTLIGMDLDLGKALGKKLGVEFAFQKAGFDAIIPGIKSGQYQLGMSSFTDSKEREKTVDFVTYFTAGSALMVKKGNPQGLKPDDLSLCGKKVAVEKGTVQNDEVSSTIDVGKGLGTRTKKCKDAGKPGPVGQPYPDQNGANLALSSGRADAVLADSPVIDYAAKQSGGQFEVSGATYDTAPYGIAVGKQLGTTKDAILGALKALQADGTYNKILDKWGITSGANTSPQINGATS
ncbi:transporter substrate-binding domain-containing protein [Actinomadura sp. LD22]|uniref:Transporter substrate-binding domain-containing protein n=1 Tax=Actinomadura physcomitrii TaxID=2650748 RepID=A0A6I4MRF5_9ACTN|nr:ABC transporter substrate-binding protein [Actinomadura physcomitrii]MWA06397.1 transporter substrate-binding domain-containing protein [Actinomadura physcomitrii]